jgi:hypothetical protein
MKKIFSICICISVLASIVSNSYAQISEDYGS